MPGPTKPVNTWLINAVSIIKYGNTNNKYIMLNNVTVYNLNIFYRKAHFVPVCNN